MLGLIVFLYTRARNSEKTHLEAFVWTNFAMILDSGDHKGLFI